MELRSLSEPICDTDFHSMIRTMIMLGIEPYVLVNKFDFTLGEIQTWAAGNGAPPSLMRARIWDYLKELLVPISTTT